MIPVRRIGHATFETPDLERQAEYYSAILGLSVLSRTPKQVILGSPAGQEIIMFEAGSAARCTRMAFQLPQDFDLATINGHLSKFGLKSDTQRDITPAIAQAATFIDPKGTVIELFSEHRPSPVEAKSAGIAPLKLGHVAFSVESPQAMADFYVQALGFRISDWIENLFVFLRCGPDHHTANFVTGSKTFMHHLAFELKDWPHFLVACDILGKHQRPIIWGPGRHRVGHNLFVYHRDPDDHIIEFYAELDLMKEEDLGFFDPRPWHKYNPQRPRVWSRDEAQPTWGAPPTPDFRRSGNEHLGQR